MPGYFSKASLAAWLVMISGGCGSLSTAPEPRDVAPELDGTTGDFVEPDDLVEGRALLGAVVVEGEDGVQWAVTVTATVGEAVFTATVDAAGRYRIEGVPSGPCIVTALGSGFYEAQVVAEILPAGETEAPVLTLRRWRMLHESSDVLFGSPLLGGLLIPYWVDLAEDFKSGALWIYLVDSDESLMLSEEASTYPGLLWASESGEFVVFDTDRSGLNHISTKHIYGVGAKKLLSSVPNVLEGPYDVAGRGLLFYVSSTSDWVPREKSQVVWFDVRRGESSLVWDGLWPMHSMYKGGSQLLVQAPWPEAHSPSTLMRWNQETKQLDVVQTDMCEIRVLSNPEDSESPLLVMTGVDGSCDSQAAGLLRPGAFDPITVDAQFDRGEVLQSPDRRYAASVSGCSPSSGDGSPCTGELNLFSVVEDGPVMNVSGGVVSGESQWSTDSQYLVFVRRTRAGTYELARFDMESMSLLVLSAHHWPLSPVLGSDAAHVSVWKSGEGEAGLGELWLFNLTDGTGHLLSARAQGSAYFSGDGKGLAWDELVGDDNQGRTPQRQLALIRTDWLAEKWTPAGCPSSCGAYGCHWREGSNQVVCPCGKECSYNSNGALTLFDLPTGTQKVICEPAPNTSVWFGPGETLLVAQQLLPGGGFVYLWNTSDGLDHATSQLIVSEDMTIIMVYDESDMIALVSAMELNTWDQDSTSVINVGSGAKNYYPDGLGQRYPLADGWEAAMEGGDGYNRESLLLWNWATGEMVKLSGPKQFWNGCLDCSAVLWRAGEAGAEGSGVVAFHTGEGVQWNLVGTSVGAIISSPKLEWMVAEELADPSATAPVRLVGAEVLPYNEAVHLAGNAVVTPPQLGLGAVVYGCSSSGNSQVEGICVARIPPAQH